MMNTGCPDCDKNFIKNLDMCPKHKLEFLKWRVESAQKEYEDYKTEYERKQNENL